MWIFLKPTNKSITMHAQVYVYDYNCIGTMHYNTYMQVCITLCTWYPYTSII